MDMIDISWPVTPEVVTWEDGSPPEIRQYSFMESRAPSNNSAIKMDMHTATHIDAPLHFIEGGKTIDSMDLELMVGECVVAEITESVITRVTLERAGIRETQRLLLKTPNSRLFHRSTFAKDYSALDKSAAQWVVERGIQLVGIDYLSIELYHNDGFPAHKVLLGNDVLILEGLNLANVKPGPYYLIALPLKIAGTEAAPARAVLFPHGSVAEVKK